MKNKELKTLKDMWGMKDDKRKPRHLIINDFKEELKQEAIKWVKKIQNHLDTTKLPMEIRLLEEGQLPFIKTFFNITELELENA